MRRYAIIVYGAPAAFPSTSDGFTWTSHPGGVWDPGAQQIEFQIEEWNASTPTENSTLTVHGVSFQQIKQNADLNGLPIAVWGGMAPGLPIANYQAQHYGLLVAGRINRCWGNWVGTEMSIGFQITAGGNTEGTFGGLQGEAPAGNGGGGSPSAGGQIRLARTGELAAPVRYLRNGARSLDKRPFPRGRMSPQRRGLAVSPFDATTTPGSAGTISGPSVGGTPFGTGTGFDFGAATSQIGGVVSSLFGGGTNGLQAPLNLIHNMMPSMPLSAAIAQTLGTAFPAGGLNILISAMQLAYQDAGVYQNMQQYAQYIKNLSLNLLGGGSSGYPGVNMTSYSNTINVWDGTAPVTEGTVSILDLIGQPTWIGPRTIHVKTVLRGDLHGGSFITLPATLMSVTPDAIVPGLPGPEQRTNDAFAGTFVITRVLYIGDFRNPDGVGWSANYEAVIK